MKEQFILFDGGKLADEKGVYTFDSVKKYIESKGKTNLIFVKEGELS